jgi:hypothetical protein
VYQIWIMRRKTGTTDRLYTVLLLILNENDFIFRNRHVEIVLIDGIFVKIIFYCWNRVLFCSGIKSEYK